MSFLPLELDMALRKPMHPSHGHHKCLEVWWEGICLLEESRKSRERAHSKDNGANLGESGRDVINIVSCLSLTLYAVSALGISALV